jgi:DNA-binding beta-propeller fold protein YncE
MPADCSRTLFDHAKHYSGVLMQQGRVQLDADWNEQLAIQQHRTARETVDVIGPCGVPKKTDSFFITHAAHGNDLQIEPGQIYVEGLLCELDPTPMPITFPPGTNNKQAVVANLLLDGRTLEQAHWVEISAEHATGTLIVQIVNVDPNSLTLTMDSDISAYQNAGTALLRRVITYATQADYLNPEWTLTSPVSGLSGGPVTLADGSYLVFLEAWQREVNALEDRRIRETALGGPDTTERLQTVWQVKLLRMNELTSPPSSPLSSPPSCSTDFPAWDQYVAPMTGMLNAQTTPPGTDQNPCVLPPSAGYQSLENQLYRIEIFQGASTNTQATFVWSRDNASVESAITKVDDMHIYLHDLGKDNVLGFAKGQWVEIVDRADELHGKRFLAQITEQPDPTANKVTLSKSATAYAGRDGLRLRRWDMTGSNLGNGIPIIPGWIDLEAGIQVQFLDGSYAPRAYWQIPARTGTGEIEWPAYEVPNAHPIPQLPLGVKHHYCKLAQLDVSGGLWMLYDCRKHFPSLTTICADDVCYDSRCDMPGVATVQDALDQLCLATDLREHNKYLHGWGIVCGLEVTCGPDAASTPRRHITAHTGRAIDCNGNDVILDTDRSLDVVNILAPVVPQTDGTWLMTNYTRGDIPDLVFIESINPGSGKVEVHAASGKSNYQTFIQDAGTTFAPETDGTWLMADYDQDGIPDLVFIKTSNTGTGKVEVHIASGKSNYQTRILETGTTFAPETDGVWLMADYDRDGIPDLVFIKTSNTGTGKVEVHIASGKSNYQTRILETGTTFAPETDGVWLMADYDRDGIPDLVFIKTSNTGTGKVEVHIASGKSIYQTRILETGTTFAPETDGVWLMADYDLDGIPDLVFIKTSNTANGYVEVQVASAKSNYQTRIQETGTALVPHPIPDGDYCLILDPAVTGRFRFVPYDPSWNSFKSLLTDSLLMDFYNDCIRNLADFFKRRFTPQLGDTDLVSPAQKRFTTIVTNLFLSQYTNTDNGSFIFLSQAEHNILQTFYNDLRNLLQSKTYCAMFDGARGFPKDYPFAALGINTIFGKGLFSFVPKPLRTRMRVDPTGRRAYTMGTDSVIDVYDLQKQQMAVELQFPTPGAVVHDLAFSADGNQVYVVANLNNTDTAFATATVNGLQHTWSGTIVVCNKILITLATWTSPTNAIKVLAIASDGLYVIDPANVSATPTPTYAFNGFGHLVVDEASNQAYATACSTPPVNNVVNHFDQVIRLDLLNQQQPFAYPLVSPPAAARGDDTDDIAVVPANQLPNQPTTGQLFVSYSLLGQADKRLAVFPSSGNSPAAIANNLDLGENSTVSIAYNQVTNFLMLSFEDSYRIKLYRPDRPSLEEYRHPVQVQPIVMTFQKQTSAVYVWNDVSNTITVIPAAEVAPVNSDGFAQAWPLSTLLNYRVAVIDAFLDLTGGALQYFKDCFCDHLLVNCPSCDEDDQLFLASISIRNNEVYKVCNFSKRRYVKSFPTVGYWLSPVPIVPLLHWVVEKFCCAALAEHFGVLKAPQPSGTFVANPTGGNYQYKYSAQSVRSGVNFTTGLKENALSAVSKVAGSSKFLGAAVASPRIPTAIAAFSGIKSADLVGQTADAAKSKLAASNISVDAVLPFDKTQVATNVTRHATMPQNLKPGTVVTLVADEQGMVQYYMLSSAPPVQEQLNSALTQLASLHTTLADVQATNAKELAVRDLAIQNLQAQVQKISTVVKLPG